MRSEPWLLRTEQATAPSAAAEDISTRFALNGLDCGEFGEFVQGLILHQAGVRTVVAYEDGHFFSVFFDDKVSNVALLVAALEMFGYYPTVVTN